MTNDVHERTDLSRYRSLGGTIFMTVAVIAGPLVLYVDNQPVAGRFLMMASVCGLIGFFCLMVTSVWCKERFIAPPRPEGEKLHYGHILKEIAKNRALIGMIFASLISMIAASIVNGLNTFLFRDYFGNIQIMAVSGMLSTLYSIITFVGTKFVAKKFGKKEWSVYGLTFAGLVVAALFFFPIQNPILFIIINGICYLGASGLQILVWAMVNDSIDYHELKTGERNEGMVYATYSFFRKLSGAISGSASSFVLALIGFDAAAQVQTEAVRMSLWKSYTGIYSIGYLLAAVVLFLVYPLTKQKTIDMLAQLAAKRKAAAESVKEDA